jgi:hypothetical protein
LVVAVGLYRFCEQREAITRLLHLQLPGATDDPDRWNRHAVSCAWRQQREALARDADAVLKFE